MKKLIDLIMILIIAGVYHLYSNPPDSCLKLYLEDEPTFQNPDSVKVDSCIDSETYGQYYAKQFFWVKFTYNVLPRTEIYTPDTIIEYKWYNIDTSYQETRQGFQLLEQTFGNFWLREELPNKPDTTLFLPRCLLLRFENYVNIDSIIKYVNEIKLINYLYYMRRYGSVPNVEDRNSEINEIFIYPQPASNILYIKISKNIIYNKQIELINIEGEIIAKKLILFNESINIINFSDIPTGIYFIKIGKNLKPIIIIK